MSVHRKMGTLFSVLAIVAMVLTACGGGETPTAAPQPTEAAQPTEETVTELKTGDLLDQIMAAGKMVVSSDPNYAPQSFLNDKGELDGFDISVAQEVAKRLGVEVEFVTPDWDMITGGNWSARWDLSIGSMTPTEPRSEVLWFTDPYYYTPASFAVHKDNTDIATVTDLAGKTLGLGTATTYDSYLDGSLAMYGGEVMYDPPAGIDVKAYSTDGEAIQDLALGDGVRLDAVMSAQPTIQTAIDSGVPLKYVGTPAFYEPLVFALDKNRGPSDKMLAKLNEIMAEMHEDGTLTELSIEWYGVDLTTLVVPEEAAAPAEKDLLDEIMAAGKMVVSTDPNYAPQSFLNDKGELDGFDIDTAKEVAKRLGVEVEFVTPDWDMITGGNWSARWDLSIGSMTPTEPRSEVLWFTDPYYYTPASFAVHKDNTDVATVTDLAGKTLGLGTATTYDSYLDGSLAMYGGEVMYDPPAGIDVKAYSTDGEAIQDLALGDGVRLDAVMSAQPTIQTAIDSGVPLKYVGTPAFYEPLVFALDKNRGPSDKMLAKLNEIMAEMHEDGTLTELSIEWYGVDLTTLVVPE